jgi:hypothetical protein
MDRLLVFKKNAIFVVENGQTSPIIVTPVTDLGLTRPISELIASAFMTTELTRCFRLKLVATAAAVAASDGDDADEVKPFSLFGLAEKFVLIGRGHLKNSSII